MKLGFDEKFQLSNRNSKIWYGVVGFEILLCIILNTIFEFSFLVFPGNAFVGIWAAILMFWFLLLRLRQSNLQRAFEYLMILYGLVNFINYLVGGTYAGAWYILWTSLVFKTVRYEKQLSRKANLFLRGLWWFGLVLAFFIATLTFIQGFFSAVITSYPAPGQFVTITNRGAPFKVHYLCSGESDGSKPTVILQSGGGSPGMSLYGIQLKLAENGYKACYFDRAGYGYSDPQLYLPHDQVKAVEDQIEAVKLAGISGDKVVVGHSVGGQIAIRMNGLDNSYKMAILLDSVQANYIKEIDSKIPNTYWSNASDEMIIQDNERVKGALTIYRFFWTWAIVSFFTGNSGFNPSSEQGRYAALYHQDKVWQSQYYDWIGFPVNEQSNELADSLKYKDFPIHVLRAVGNCTNFAVQPVDQKACDQANVAYQVNKDAAERQISITNKGSVEFCKQPCDHSYPYSQVDMAADYVLEKLKDFK